MKTIYIFLLGMFLGFGIFAQQTPEFEFQLYFEDALGNRDTVTIGYDPAATDGVDADFGEENILNQPWSDVFEVRVTNEYWIRFFSETYTETPYHLQKQIVNKNNPIKPISLDIKCNHWPIKVSWDSINFIPSNVSGTFITSIEYGTWFNLSRPDFLSEKNQVFYDTNIMNTDLDHWVMSHYQIDTFDIYNVWFEFKDSISLSINVDDIRQENISIYPNPIHSNGTININSTGNYTIIDLKGKVHQTGKIENNKIQLNSYESGMYILKLENNGTIHQQKITVL